MLRPKHQKERDSFKGLEEKRVVESTEGKDQLKMIPERGTRQLFQECGT